MIKKLLALCFAFFILESKAQTYYESGIAQIFQARCTNCHNQYGHFPLLTYSDAYNKAGDMLVRLGNNTMPPWPPDTTYTRFFHERLMTNQERTDVINWINNGLQYIDTTLAPTPPSYPKYKLSGTPSTIVQIPTYTSTATTADKYNCFVVPSGLTQDMYLRAFEIVPGDPTIVHHVVVTIDTTASSTSDLSGGCYTQPGQFSIGGFAPGADPTIFPSGQALKLGMRIKAGSQIVMQIHYPKGTAGSVDSTQIRMFFYPVGTTGIRPLIARTLLQNWNMAIPANTTATYTAQSSVLPVDWSIYSTFPHSHKICTSLYNWADSTGGTKTIPLIRINKWDFDWQDYYMYHNMVRVPKGFRLRSSHFFDNTTNNPNNPTPAMVTAGFNTNNEMLFDAFMYTNYQAGDENISIDTLLMNDSLLTIGVPEYKNALAVKVSAFPNPFNEKVSIVYDIDKPARVKVAIFNIFGQEVAKLSDRLEMPGPQRHDWDGKSNGVPVAPGSYLYKVTIDGKTITGKLILQPKN